MELGSILTTEERNEVEFRPTSRPSLTTRHTPSSPPAHPSLSPWETDDPNKRLVSLRCTDTRGPEPVPDPS